MGTGEALTSSSKWSSSTLALAVGDEPPAAVRIFRAGENRSTKGPVVFDEKAAEMVMADFEARAVDGMIDLEHLSLDQDSRNFDPDARGWYALEVRRDASGGPELWMNVRWAPDGERRIREKRQRYLSPAFDFFTESRRVCAIHNIGLVANPATHGAQPLIAASARGQVVRYGDLVTLPQDAGTQRIAMADGQLTIENIAAVAKALKMPSDTPIADMIRVLSEAGKAGAEMESEESAEEEAPVEAPPADFAADPVEPKPDEEKKSEEDETKLAAMAASARIVRLTGKPLAASLDEIETWRASHVEIEAGREKLRLENEKLEAAERRSHVVELVKLGVELPATAWEDPLAKSPKITKRLADEPLGDLRKRVETWRAVKGGKPATNGTRPPGATASGEDGSRSFKVGTETVTLSARELAVCVEEKVDPEKYAAAKQRRGGK